MSRLTLALILCAAALAAACGDDDTPTAPTDPPVAVTETFSGTLTLNGGVTHRFDVQRAGEASAQLTALVPSEAIVGLSVGPLSGQGCTAQVANDAATSGSRIIGNASVGVFCVRVFDSAARVTAPVEYTVTVTHF
jgi:hypothetical protein